MPPISDFLRLRPPGRYSPPESESDPPEPEARNESGNMTPTATETVLPWKRDDSDSAMSSGPVKQSEFPAWCSNKEYIAYSSPSATFLGGIDQPKTASVIGLFRRESSGSVKGIRSRANSESSLPVIASSSKDSSAGILLIEEGVGIGHPTDLLGGSTGSTASTSSRRPLIGRRGSMLELSSSVDPIPEEDLLTGSIALMSPRNSLPSLTDGLSESGTGKKNESTSTPYAAARRHYPLGNTLTSLDSSRSSIDESHI